MPRYAQVQTQLQATPQTWLITGVAGFIGSNLLETLLKLDQRVIGLDNFATGYQRNLDEVQTLVTPAQWSRFNFILGDIRQLDDCRQACTGIDWVLHQAALGSVPRSLEDPITTNGTNIDGFLNMLVAARDQGVARFVYAASSSTYGDHPGLPKQEDRIGKPLAPYAVTQDVNARSTHSSRPSAIHSHPASHICAALAVLSRLPTGRSSSLELADIDKARVRLGYAPSHRFGGGLAEALARYVTDS